MTNKQVFANKPSQLSTKEQSVGKTRILTGAAMLSAVAYAFECILLYAAHNLFSEFCGVVFRQPSRTQTNCGCTFLP